MAVRSNSPDGEVQIEMGFLDSLSEFLVPFAQQQGGGGLVTTQPDPGFFGTGPGLDAGDIPDILGRIFGQDAINPLGLDLSTFPVPIPGGLTRGGGEEGALLRLLGLGGGAPARSPGKIRSSMYIGGNCPGLWHTTPVRTVFDKRTGVGRQVGGNRRANPVSLVQDDDGALQFFAPVESSGWRFKYKTGRRRSHTHRVTHRHGTKTRRRATSGHRHKLTRKQLAAGFGGKAHMRAH